MVRQNAPLCSSSNVDPISIKINKILRLILNVKFIDYGVPNISTSDMYKELRLLKFEDLYQFNLLKFLHYMLYVNHDLFDKYFSPLLPNHSYSTRNTRINFPGIRLRIERNFTVFRICKLMNEIPEEFLEQQSKNSLKNKFNDYKIDRYE